MDYFKDNIKLFIESFRADKRILGITAAFDLILMGFIALFVYFWKSWISSSFSGIISLDLPTLTEEILRQTTLLKSFFYSLIISLVVLGLLIFIVFSFFKGIIWCSISDKHFDLEYLKKFLLLNLVCIPLFIAVFFIFLIITSLFIHLFGLIATSIQGSLATVLFIFLLFFIVFMPLLIYTMIPLSLVYYYFTKKNDIKYSFKKMFNNAIKKIHLFYTPCLLITIVFVLISIVTIPLGFIPESIAFWIFLIISFLYVAWARIYIISFAESLNKTNKKHHKI